MLDIVASYGCMQFQGFKENVWSKLNKIAKNVILGLI